MIYQILLPGLPVSFVECDEIKHDGHVVKLMVGGKTVGCISIAHMHMVIAPAIFRTLTVKPADPTSAINS